MSTVKRTLVNVSFYDPEAIQRKLEQMAARGWMIQKVGNLFWTYTKIPPQKLRFAVTYFPGASEFDPKPSEKQLEKEELCAQDGWRLVLRWDVMQIFCTDREDAVPIDTDPVPQVDNIHPVAELIGTKLDEVFIGSCTNGRLEDLAAAAAQLEGKKVAPGLRLIVTPASRSIYIEAVKAGYIGTLVKAGAIVTQPGCGLCCGRAGGILADSETVLATNNRNFLGRMGTSKVEIYLASPATAAASALAGKITQAR